MLRQTLAFGVELGLHLLAVAGGELEAVVDGAVPVDFLLDLAQLRAGVLALERLADGRRDVLDADLRLGRVLAVRMTRVLRLTAGQGNCRGNEQRGDEMGLEHGDSFLRSHRGAPAPRSTKCTEQRAKDTLVPVGSFRQARHMFRPPEPAWRGASGVFGGFEVHPGGFASPPGSSCSRPARWARLVVRRRLPPQAAGLHEELAQAQRLSARMTFPCTGCFDVTPSLVTTGKWG